MSDIGVLVTERGGLGEARGGLQEFKGGLQVKRQPTRVVETFGYPGGSFTLIDNGYGGPITLGAGDEWVANVETFEDVFPHWWEIGMNFRSSYYYNDSDEFAIDTDGFSYISWTIYINGEPSGGGGPNGYVHTVFVPENSTVEILVSGVSIPEGRWANFSPHGYAIKVRV